MLPRSASRHERRLARLNLVTLAAVRRAWRRMTPAGSWETQYRDDIGPKVTGLVVAAQIAVTRESDAYVADVLNELAFGPETEPGVVLPASLAGVAGDGRPVESLLASSVGRARAATKTMPPDEALKDALAFMETVTQTIIADAARAAEEVAMAQRPWVDGYIRIAEPGACSRCIVLAGKFYLFNDGFPRHPQCFPAGTVVSGPGSLAASRRWYEGELLTIRTASGKQLSVTANHPILTRFGWMPANLLGEGVDVLSRASGDRTEGLLVPDEDQVPARIEDVWSAGRVDSLTRVPVAAEDFHGDGVGSGYVDVVSANSFLGDRVEPTLFQECGQQALTVGTERSITLAASGVASQLAFASLRAANGALSGHCPGGPLLGREGSIHGIGGLAGTPDRHAGSDEAESNRRTAHAVALTEREFALSGLIGSHNGGVIENHVAPRWDAPLAPFSMENRVAYASRGNDLGLRLSGQVAADRIVEITRVSWSGHVYNLTTSEGWYDADGFIVSNCRCNHVPAPKDPSKVAGLMAINSPDRYFESLTEAEQDRIFTKAGAEAIRNGADLSRVVNARRGMKRAQVAGRDVLVTTEGTTRRGRRAGQRPGVRLMPETLFEIAGDDRDEALRLLRLNGYLA